MIEGKVVVKHEGQMLKLESFTMEQVGLDITAGLLYRRSEQDHNDGHHHIVDVNIYTRYHSWTVVDD